MVSFGLDCREARQGRLQTLFGPDRLIKIFVVSYRSDLQGVGVNSLSGPVRISDLYYDFSSNALLLAQYSISAPRKLIVLQGHLSIHPLTTVLSLYLPSTIPPLG